MAIATGIHLDHYEIIAPLGAGGMGEIWRARDTRLNREVAIKVLPASFANDKDRLRRFKQEARAASALNHPNILTIFEIGAMDGDHYIATEFIDGRTLREWLTGDKPSLSAALDVATQIAAALAAAHEAKIIHRDIKPENVMVRRDGIVKVLDFGLAKLTEQRRETPETVDSEALTIAIKTDPGTVMGTASYMSPEQARGQEVDARTDIFSLGVVLYEMIAGCPPFEGMNALDVISAILQKEPAPLSHHVSEAPDELQRIVDKALRKQREERYQRIQELLIDLKDIKEELAYDKRRARELHTTERERKSQSIEDTPTVRNKAVDTAEKHLAHTHSGIEYLVSQIKAHPRGAGLVLTALLAILLLTACLLAYSVWLRNPERNSIAVLPFANSNNDPDAEYLCNGISESLINTLGQLPRLKVIARSSSIQYKNKRPDLREVAQALGVRAILTGSIARQGDRLLISVELMDPYEKTHLWGDQFNQQATDLLSIQSEIAREIAEKLQLKLTQTEQQQLERDKKVNPSAYELILRSRFVAEEGKGSLEAYQKAAEYLNRAIALDPTYALAWVEMSGKYYVFAMLGLDPKENLAKCRAAAFKAVSLDEKLAEAHLAVALTKHGEWDWVGWEREIKRAIELNPNLADAHSEYSAYLSLSGQHEQAVVEARRGRELNPLTPATANILAQALVNARRPQEAIETLNKLVGAKEDGPHTHEFLGRAYLQKGMYAVALAEVRQYLTRRGQDPESNPYLGYIYAVSGQRDKAVEILRRLKSGKVESPPTEMAVLYAGLGEKDQALAQLEKAYVARDMGLLTLVEEGYDSLRSDPRFHDLALRVGLMR